MTERRGGGANDRIGQYIPLNVTILKLTFDTFSVNTSALNQESSFSQKKIYMIQNTYMFNFLISFAESIFMLNIVFIIKGINADILSFPCPFFSVYLFVLYDCQYLYFLSLFFQLLRSCGKFTLVISTSHK